MKILILSDLHGNLAALERVLERTENMTGIQGCLLLGDLIDYGMHSNEVIRLLQRLPYPILCNIWGNHEQVIVTGDFSRFSSLRGQECAQYTKSVLDQESWRYIQNDMVTAGQYVFEIEGKKCLAVHGSLEDHYWKSINAKQNLEDYQTFPFAAFF